MSIEVGPGDWTCLDPWWSVYAQIQPIARSSTSAQVLDREELADCWDELDPWWQAYTDSSPVVHDSPSARSLVNKQLADSWAELAPWWDVYTETGHETAVALARVLDRSNDKWRQSPGPFDTDPLAADLTLDQFPHGPLQPSDEMGWSRWLARLLQPSAKLVTELFDGAVGQPPDEVVREDQLSKHDDSVGSFRLTS